MKNYRIYLIPILVSSFFSVQSMNTDQANDGNAQKAVEQCEAFNPLSLMHICTKNVTNLLNQKKINIAKLYELPEEIISYIGYFNHLYLILYKCRSVFDRVILSSHLGLQTRLEYESIVSSLTNDIIILFEKLIKSKSALFDIFILALKEILQDNNFRMNPNSNNSALDSIIDNLRIIKQMIILANNQESEINTDEICLSEYLDDAAMLNKPAIITLLLQLRKPETENYKSDKLFAFHYALQSPESSLDFAKYLYDLLNITREDLIKLLKKQEHQLLYFTIMYSNSVEKINYIFELMEKHKIEIKEFINKEYQLEDNDPVVVLLATLITHKCNPDIIKLLISNGADLCYKNDEGEDILTIAQKKFKMIQIRYLLGLCNLKKYNKIAIILSDLQKIM